MLGDVVYRDVESGRDVAYTLLSLVGGIQDRQPMGIGQSLAHVRVHLEQWAQPGGGGGSSGRVAVIPYLHTCLYTLPRPLVSRELCVQWKGRPAPAGCGRPPRSWEPSSKRHARRPGSC